MIVLGGGHEVQELHFFECVFVENDMCKDFNGYITIFNMGFCLFLT